MYAGAIGGGWATGGGSSAASADDAAPTLNAVANAKRFMACPLDPMDPLGSTIYTKGIGMPLQECNGSAKNKIAECWRIRLVIGEL